MILLVVIVALVDIGCWVHVKVKPLQFFKFSVSLQE